MDELQQNLQTNLQLLGIAMPTPAYIFGATLFGFVGLWAYVRGRKDKQQVFKWLGLALMVYPLFVADTLMMYAVGIALCVGLFLYRNPTDG